MRNFSVWSRSRLEPEPTQFGRLRDLWSRSLPKKWRLRNTDKEIHSLFICTVCGRSEGFSFGSGHHFSFWFQSESNSTPSTNSNSYLNMFQPLTEGCNIWAGSTLIFNFQSSNPDRGFFGSESAILAFTVLYYCLFGYICNVHKVKELQPYSEPKFWYSTKSVWVRICFAVSRSD